MIPRLGLRLLQIPRHESNRPSRWRTFSVAPALSAKPLPPRMVIKDEDIEEKFLKGSGPGGQKINKTNSAVQLKHLPTGYVVKCQETRSRTQNRKLARRLLSDRLEDIELGDQSRTALKRQAAAKKKASKAKKSRRKYRKLDDEKAAVAGASEDDLEDEDDEDEPDREDDHSQDIESSAKDKLIEADDGTLKKESG